MSLVEFVIDKLDDLKGTEIVHFDVKGKSSITENMIICTGTSSRQVAAMADNLIAECKKPVMKPLVKKVVIQRIGSWLILVKPSFTLCSAMHVRCIS